MFSEGGFGEEEGIEGVGDEEEGGWDVGDDDLELPADLVSTGHHGLITSADIR